MFYHFLQKFSIMYNKKLEQSGRIFDNSSGTVEGLDFLVIILGFVSQNNSENYLKKNLFSFR